MSLKRRQKGLLGIMSSFYFIFYLLRLLCVLLGELHEYMAAAQAGWVRLLWKSKSVFVLNKDETRCPLANEAVAAV